MNELVNFIVRQFTDDAFKISLSFSLIILALMVVFWVLNRRKFHQLKHQIPADVVKNYLDSIIQNSNSLKSSLFRGGGLDVSEGIPSVFPLGSLPSGNVSSGGPSMEELNQKNAEIASLRATVADKDRIIKDLEARLASGGGASADDLAKINQLTSENSSLKSQLEQALASASNSGGGEEVQGLTKERDELKERLMEYEIIEEDLANLKRLQQENEQLKKSLEAMNSGGAAPAPAPAVEEEEEDLEAQMAAAITESAPAPSAPVDNSEVEEELGVPANEGEQKSAEELLSEFEKMLG
ncbi:MAG: hypothetical protein H6622_06805 [Halobacteriovoraceae bacterium]|nr:hypothetical protein [Halobacteriovoraceae bacterium]